MTSSSAKGISCARCRAAASIRAHGRIARWTGWTCAVAGLLLWGLAGSALAQLSSEDGAASQEPEQVEESTLIPPDPEDAQTKYLPTGPPPKGGYEPYVGAVNKRDEKVIGGVPGYLWRHGCGPTSCGMVIGYWDGQGFPSLIPGSAATQTAAVNHAIASGNPPCGTTGIDHYRDYSCPRDEGGPVQPDTSELGGAHAPHHCLGDFGHTSWSVDGLGYGGSYWHLTDNSLRDYVDYINTTEGTSYTRTSSNESWSSSLWDHYCDEINLDRPVAIIVDVNGNGNTDHLVTGIGWRDTLGYNQYACRDTWSTGYRWEEFRPMSITYTWGVHGITKFTILGAEDDCNGNGVLDEDDILQGTSEDCQPNDVPDECDVNASSGGTSEDCTGNGIPDECEPDCNGNLVADSCDINGATSNDCQPNGVPDECDINAGSGGTSHDCQPNDIPDECEDDCNNNGYDDSCDLAGGTSLDCNDNLVPDECDVALCDSFDCNTNNIPDECDIAVGGVSQDCNGNLVPDECDGVVCSNPWNGFEDNPPFGWGTPMGGLDTDGDGIAWQDPNGVAFIDDYGCPEYTQAVAVNVWEPDPEEGYVISEHFQALDGELDCGAVTASLSFSANVDAIDSSWDWVLRFYDARNDGVVMQIEFASTESNRGGVVPGHIMVKSTGSGYIDTGFVPEWSVCFDMTVVLDNQLREVQLYINDSPVLSTPLDASVNDVRRLDYFRMHSVDNYATGGSEYSIFNIDSFELCLEGGPGVPQAAWDCNGNGKLDECDIEYLRSRDCDQSGVPDECEASPPPPLYNFDEDEDVDLTDFRYFEDCLSGPDGTPTPSLTTVENCRLYFDGDCDDDVDLSDFRGFQQLFTGE